MITMDQAASAVTMMGICRFFPSDPFQRAQLIRLLVEMVGSKSELDWIVSVQCKLDWKGPSEFRGVFCTKFRPRDGTECEVTDTPGFMPADIEMRAALEESKRTQVMLESAKREQKLLGEVPAPEPDVAAAIKPVDAPPVNRSIRNRESLAATLGVRAERPPIHIPGSPKRTPEENAAAVRELEQKLGIAKESNHV